MGVWQRHPQGPGKKTAPTPPPPTAWGLADEALASAPPAGQKYVSWVNQDQNATRETWHSASAAHSNVCGGVPIVRTERAPRHGPTHR
jgi:hypothetical protein